MKHALVIVALNCLWGCAPDTCPSDKPATAVMTPLTFARSADDGVTPGFDLDGVDTLENGSCGFGVADFVAPWGETGIDNAMANLMPA